MKRYLEWLGFGMMMVAGLAGLSGCRPAPQDPQAGAFRKIVYESAGFKKTFLMHSGNALTLEEEEILQKRLEALWEQMMTALEKKDIPGAMAYCSAASRAFYTNNFERLSDGEFKTLLTRLKQYRLHFSLGTREFVEMDAGEGDAAASVIFEKFDGNWQILLF